MALDKNTLPTYCSKDTQLYQDWVSLCGNLLGKQASGIACGSVPEGQFFLMAQTLVSQIESNTELRACIESCLPCETTEQKYIIFVSLMVGAIWTRDNSQIVPSSKRSYDVSIGMNTTNYTQAMLDNIKNNPYTKLLMNLFPCAFSNTSGIKIYTIGD